MNRFRWVRVLLVTVMVSVLSVGSVLAESRTWRDASGAFTLNAEMLGYADGKVKLKKEDGSTIEVEVSRLSSNDQQYVQTQQGKLAEASASEVGLEQMSGKPNELANDDGKPMGKKSFPRGIAASFQVESEDQYLTGIKFHGGRYGLPRPPKEDFVVTLCDRSFKPIAEFEYPYSRVARGNPKWVTLPIKPTQVPTEFVVCLNFKPTSTKGVFISHDAEGKGLVGLPGKPAGAFTGGDWMVRALVDKRK